MSSDQYFGPASCPLVLNMGDGRGDTETPCRAQEHGAPGLAVFRLAVLLVLRHQCARPAGGR